MALISCPLFNFLTHYNSLRSYITNAPPSTVYNVNKSLSFTPDIYFFPNIFDNINITSYICTIKVYLTFSAMNNNYLHRDPGQPYYPRRVSKPRYKCETVLSTEVLPLVRAQQWRDNLIAISKQHRDAWFIKYVFGAADAEKAVLRVPAVIAQMNRSRVLRRAKISGARMCNIHLWNGRHKHKYLTDIVVSCSFDAMVFASLLNSFDTFDNGFTITFKPLNVAGRNRKQILRHHIDELIEKFYRRSKFPRNMVAIHRCEDDDFFGSFDLEFCTVKPIFDVCLIACDIFGDEIDGIKFKGGPTFEMSRSPNIDLDDYVTRPFDKITSHFVYRQFRGFGQYSDNREILKLLKPNL